MSTLNLPDKNNNEFLDNELSDFKVGLSSKVTSFISNDDTLTCATENITIIDNYVQVPLRKDAFGNEIKKGGKQKVTFIDKIRNTNPNEKTLFKRSFKEIILVQSYKKYNIIQKDNYYQPEDNYEKYDASSGKSCVIV